MCYFSGGIIEPCGLISCGSKIQHSTTYRPMVSSQEGNYVKEFALHHDHHVSRSTCGPRSEDVASIDDVMESEAAMLCRSNVAKTLVLESTAADVKNVPIECNEEMVHNTSVDDTVATAYYIKQSISDSSKERYSEEETGTNVDKDYDPQRTSQNADFTLTEGLPSKDVRTFVADDDRTSLDNSMFGILLHNRGNSKAIIARNSELADPRGDSDRPHKPQDHQLPYPIVTTNIGSLVKPVTCTGNGSEPVTTTLHQPCQNATAVVDDIDSQIITGYIKPVYPVLVGDSVRICSTSLFASLPQHNKFLVKERLHDHTVGFSRAKLVLKSCVTEVEEKNTNHQTPNQLVHYDVSNDHGDNDDDDDVTSAYYRQNCSSPGRILYTCDRRFNGRTKYPLPNGRAVSSKIGKGGNGFVFTMYHDRKQYAVKKTVYRANEVNVHSALKHKNVLPLLAVLMGEKHERHHSKFYCFHFMPRMDCDLRQILSSKEVGCMKYFYRNCSKEPARWEKGFNNIKFVLAETLEALAYIHSNGFVHRDVKASNIMIKMRCHCRPLECTCSSKFQVKLGDFDSAGTVPGLGITEPTDQMIKFASILPLGTPGYRAPEVSMHIVLSGPYETLYTTAVDMWSFGCLCLNICIGKTAALKQREEASLLLSRTHFCSTELWEKTTKINELRKAKPFCNEPELIRLVAACLQVNSANRPSANDAIKMLHSAMS